MLPMDETRLRDKYSLAFRPPSPPLPLQWREMTDDEIMALEIPGVDPNAPPTLHADQVDMAICEKLRVSFVIFILISQKLELTPISSRVAYRKLITTWLPFILYLHIRSFPVSRNMQESRSLSEKFLG